MAFWILQIIWGQRTYSLHVSITRSYHVESLRHPEPSIKKIFYTNGSDSWSTQPGTLLYSFKKEVPFLQMKRENKTQHNKRHRLGNSKDSTVYYPRKKYYYFLDPLYLYNLLYSWLVQLFFQHFIFFLFKYQPNFLKTFVSSFHYLSHKNNTPISTTIGIPLMWIFRTLRN